MYHITQNDQCTGGLKVTVNDLLSRPIKNATINIYENSDSGTPVYTLTTNVDGQTEPVALDAPNRALSMSPGVIIPYAQYNIVVTADGYLPVTINGINIFCEILSLQNVVLADIEGLQEVFNIGPNTLYGNYPDKIPEAEIKPITDTGEIVLNEVVIPEFIVVHDGLPNDPSAPDYYIRFTDYIKNVASSEIYPTWPEETIKANVLAIISFTLNRVYSEW